MELVSGQKIPPPQFNKKTNAHEISKVMSWHYVCPPFFLMVVLVEDWCEKLTRQFMVPV